MKKSGFTLIELLGVIVILGVIGMITVPIVTGIISDSKQNASDAQITSIKRAAKNYANANVYTIDCETKAFYITIKDLINKGYLEDEVITDAKSGTKYTGTERVEIKCNGNKFKYKFPA